MQKRKWWAGCVAGLLGLLAGCVGSAQQQTGKGIEDPATLVNPLIGTTNGGNDYPGATLPLGMVAWSPEEPRNRPRQPVLPTPAATTASPAPTTPYNNICNWGRQNRPAMSLAVGARGAFRADDDEVFTGSVYVALGLSNPSWWEC